MKHLLVDISAHGFGHLAQTTAVLNALTVDDLRLTVRSMAPEAVLAERIKRPFELVPYQQDNGMVMHDALSVDASSTMDWYRQFHHHYAARKQQATRELARLQPDLIFANVPYLSLDAAGQLGIPAIALCSLNWADIFLAYCGAFPGSKKIHAEIQNAYAQATKFLQATPAMPMPDLNNTQTIAPIAMRGAAQKAHLHTCVKQAAFSHFVLVALGGIGLDYPLEQWPEIAGVGWIFPDSVLAAQPSLCRTDFIAQSVPELDYIDLIASCDMVLTKTGYGTQTEAVIHQVPVICIERPGWPEQPYLFDWHQQHGEIEFIHWGAIATPAFIEKVEKMLAVPWMKKPVSPAGAQQAARIVESWLVPTTG